MPHSGASNLRIRSAAWLFRLELLGLALHLDDLELKHEDSARSDVLAARAVAICRQPASVRNLAKNGRDSQKKGAGEQGGTVAKLTREFGRQVELPLVAFLHELHGLSPSLDDLVGGKCGRLAALVARVEFGAVNQGSGVVALARSGGKRGRCPIWAVLDNLVQQARPAGRSG